MTHLNFFHELKFLLTTSYNFLFFFFVYRQNVFFFFSLLVYHKAVSVVFGIKKPGYRLNRVKSLRFSFDFVLRFRNLQYNADERIPFRPLVTSHVTSPLQFHFSIKRNYLILRCQHADDVRKSVWFVFVPSSHAREYLNDSNSRNFPSSSPPPHTDCSIRFSATISFPDIDLRKYLRIRFLLRPEISSVVIRYRRLISKSGRRTRGEIALFFISTRVQHPF